MRKTVWLEYEINQPCPRFQSNVDDHVKNEVKADDHSV